MKPTFSLFQSYIKQISKRWVFWLFLFLDIIGLFAEMIFPSLFIPQWLYVGAFIVGLFWAGFDTYLSLLAKIPDDAKPINPSLSINFTEGNEYTYKMLSSEDLSSQEPDILEEDSGENAITRSETTLPKSFITMNIRIENLGIVKVNILSISARLNVNAPYNFMVPETYYQDGEAVNYPILLEPKKSLQLQIGDYIYPCSFLTDAQIAARTQILLKKRTTTEVVLFIEVLDPLGKMHEFKLSTNISLVPLCNLYLSYWEEINRSDIVALATGNFTVKIEKEDTSVEEESD